MLTSCRMYAVVPTWLPNSATFFVSHPASSKSTSFQLAATASSLLKYFHSSYSIWNGISDENTVDTDATPVGI